MKLPEPPPPFRFSDVGGTRVVSSRAPFLLLTAHTSGPFGGGYEDEAKEWHAAALAHGYGDRAVILDAGPRTTWRNATLALKPAAIQWALRAQPRPVVWLDADARIREPLHLFDHWTGPDLGIRLRPDRPHKSLEEGAWCSGTLYLAQTPTTRRLVDSWAIHAAEAQRGEGHFADAEGDQEILGELAYGMSRRGDLAISRLPISYCYIDRIDQAQNPAIVPVIYHTQASRRRAGDGRIGGRRWRLFPNLA